MTPAYRDVRLVIVLLSMVFTLWAIVTDDLVNSDGILYLETARYIQGGDWAAAYAHYRWPFYSVLIAGLSGITPMSLEVSAYFLNIVLLSLLAYMFIAVLIEMGANREVCIAGAVILLTHVGLNEYRNYVVRDFGYWAFYLTSMWSLMRYQSTGRIRYALAWNLYIAVATLFRIEGLVFMVLAPLILLFSETNRRGRLVAYLNANLLLFIGLVATASWVFLYGSVSANMGRLLEPFQGLQAVLVSISETMPQKAKLIGETILNKYSDEYAMHSIWATLLLILVLKIIKTTGLLAAILTAFAVTRRDLRIRYQHHAVLLGFVIINVLVLAAFLISEFFLSGRFVMPLTCTLMLPASFALHAFYKWLQKEHFNPRIKPVWLKSILIFTLFVMLMDGITSFGTSKMYIKEAGQWLGKNAPANARIYSNEAAIYYYAGFISDIKAINHARHTLYTNSLNAKVMKRYQFVAMKVIKKRRYQIESLNKLLNSKPVYQSKNDRGDMVLIYQILS